MDSSQLFAVGRVHRRRSGEFMGQPGIGSMLATRDGGCRLGFFRKRCCPIFSSPGEFTRSQ
ncbi:hypothetical protein THTE_3272 [Thermogutta terrifontis]|uniref:Uncharacterized protein n=1 Tax=Thermogutta terrifontis TaxID=1331910 RepID=A0A286RIU4_9BACT|nr:hypothetical protein THTE_3272 [Thermogutta terrifontis]